MYDVLKGVRVVEAGSFVFVPLAAAILADWGAEVVKVEPPATGDPYRGLVTAGAPSGHDGIDLSFQYANRGKRSIGLDLAKPRGREVLARLIGRADVFMTNQRPAVRRRLGIELDDLRAMNERIVYVRGSGYGQHGALAETAALDGTAYWARGGIGAALTPPGSDVPLVQRPAVGDVMAAMTLAGGVAAALYRRAVEGVAPVVDVALQNVGMWQSQRDILGAQFTDTAPTAHNLARGERNPMTDTYRTSDGRFISLAVVNPDAYWTEFCTVLGHPELLADERFSNMASRNEHGKACVAALDAIFGAHDFEHWRRTLAGFSGAWAPVQTPADLYTDDQAIENGFFTDIDAGSDRTFKVVSSPVTFDDRGADRRMPGAPEVGQHTEELLLELGHSWDDILELKLEGIVN